MIGETVFQYKILSKIGEGGMGTVYLAEDTELDRRVALKFLPERFASDAAALTRFRREAQAIAALNHANIITIYEIGDHRGAPFIAMPYIEGEILSDVIADGPIPVDRAVDIVHQVCAGLDRAHAAGIVHRDIKPGNILIDRNGLVKILDFGLAKASTDTRITADYSAIGTVHYMSPEQARGEEVDGRSDIFSLGSVFYEMLAGKPPFKGDRSATILYSIEKAQPQKLRTANKEVTPDLERTVLKMLAKNPADRYATAGEVAMDLPVGPHTVTTSTRIPMPASRPLRRFRGVVPGAIVLIAAVFAIFAARALFMTGGDGTDGPPGGRKKIAVLPFENLGAPEEAYFADGITEEISTRLAAVPELGVISRTSTLQYKGTDKTTKVIGEELGVDYVLQGTVRWDRSGEESRVLITPELIRVSDDTYLWSAQYDRVIDDFFQTQSEIAANVIDKLNVTLLDPARAILDAPPTKSIEAYQAYLYGLETVNSAEYGGESVNRGVAMFERAVALDPEFAQAYAELSRLHSRTYHLGIDRTTKRLVMAKEAADRARMLAPDLAQTRLAMAYYYYWGFKDYDNALAELDAAAKDGAADSRVVEARGYILRRQGKYEESVDNLKRAFELSPRDPGLATEVANTYLGLWRFEEARSYYDLTIALAPEWITPYTLKVRNQLLWDGDLVAARKILDEMPASTDVRAVWFKAAQELFEGNYDAVIEQLSPRRDDIYMTHAQVVPLVLTIAWAHEKRGDAEGARLAYEEALDILQKAHEERPDDFRTYMAMGLVNAGLGNRDEAIRYGERALEMYPMSLDAWAGPIVERNMVFLLARVGETDAALEKIDYLLSFPNPGASPALFRVEPRLDELRGDPRFEEILSRRSQTGQPTEVP